MERILVIIGNPIAASLSHGLAVAYREAAAGGGAQVRTIDLATASFELVPKDRDALRVRDLDDAARLGPELAGMTEALHWAEHLVFVYPVWWGTYPAAMKAFIDRTFASGVAFRYGDKPNSWERLLAGRTARLMLTMDAPAIFNRVMYRNASQRSLEKAVLWYCGVKTIGTTVFDRVRYSTPERRERWKTAAAALGARDAKRR